MKKVVELYKGILPAFGLTVDENDRIMVGGGELGGLIPLEIDGKNLFIPTDEFLKNSEYREQIAFHPLIENVLKQPSQVMLTLQQALAGHLYVCASTVIEALLNACVKQKNGEEISSPKLLRYLSGNEQCDEKTKLFFNNLIKEIEKDTSKKIFSVYLKFGGKVHGHEVARQCSITSPLLEALERAQAMAVAKSGPISVWGVEAPRKKDIELLINVIKSAFPLIEEKGYTKGSVSKMAPYSEALFEATLAINMDIMEAAKALAKQEPVTSLASYLLIDLSPLVEMLGTTSEWDMYRNTIMKTAYNEGEGWNTTANPTAPVKDYKVVSAVPNSPTEPATDVAAISKVIIANQIKRQPLTRQTLVTLPEEEQGPLGHVNRRSNYQGNVASRGFSKDEHRPTGRFEERRNDRKDPRDMSDRDLDDYERWLSDEIRYIERSGTREEKDALRDMDRDLDDVRRELDDRRRNSSSSRYDDRSSGRPRYEDRDRPHNDRRYGTQDSRPVPRVLESRRNDRRDEPRGRFDDRRR